MFKIFKPTKAFLTAVSILAGLLIILESNVQEIFRQDRTDEIAKRISIIEESENPKFIFMGASRIHSGIDVRTIASELEIHLSQVINLSGNSMENWEYGVIVRNLKSKSTLKNAVVFLAINPWSFNSNYLHPTKHTPREFPRNFSRWASKNERASFDVDQNRRDVIWSGKLKSLSLRQPIVKWQEFLTGLSRTFSRTIQPPKYHSDQSLEQVLRRDENFRAEVISKMHLNKYKFSKYFASQTINLIGNLESIGATVALVTLPLKQDYLDHITSSNPENTEYQKYLQFRNSIASDRARFYWDSAAGIGLDISSFVDYGHFSKEGSEKLSKIIADSIRVDPILSLKLD